MSNTMSHFNWSDSQCPIETNQHAVMDRRLEKDIKGLNDKIRTEAQHMLNSIEGKNARKSVKSPLAMKIIENNKL